MEYASIFWLAASFCFASVSSIFSEFFGYELSYEYYTVEYAEEEPNMTMFREPCDYLCRAPDKERMNICKVAVEHEFAIEHGIKLDEGGKLGEEKMYAFQLNSGPYKVNSPLIISACTCPTSPLIYMQNKFQGYDVTVYMVKPSEGYSSTVRIRSGPSTLGDRNDDSLFE